jgi:hypothetical protein
MDILLLAARHESGKVSLAEVSTTSVLTPSGSKLLDAVAFALGENKYLGLYFKGQAAITLYHVAGDGTSLTKVVNSELRINRKWDLLETFVLGNAPYLVAYRATQGIFEIYPVYPDFTTGVPYRFFRNHEPGITAGFDTVKFFSAQGKVAYLGYNQTTGAVGIYSLDATATSPPVTPATPNGTAPLLSLNVWSHTWAPGWTRFAFFQFGGSNFFLKTNVAKPNVNIDHVMDSLSDGTVEVISQLNLEDAQNLTFVEPFTMGNGDPYFITYRPDGIVTVERFHGNCLGWTRVAKKKKVPVRAAQLVPIKTEDMQLFALCIPKSTPPLRKAMKKAVRKG